MEQRPAQILIVDDEAPIRLTMDALLRRRGHAVTTAESAEEALDLIHQHLFDLLLLDLKMPGLSGLDVAQRAREVQPETAIIILTGHGSLETALQGMHLGVFDYMLKTSSPQEVLARVTAALEQLYEQRRKNQLFQTLHSVLDALEGEHEPEQRQAPVESQIEVGDLRLSTWNQAAYLDGRKLNLTPTEFRILVCLAQHAGQVLTYQQIVQFAQGYESDALEASELIKPHIHHLRQKIEPDPANPRYILTVRGAGYLFAAAPSDKIEQPVAAREVK
ncbi:MAG TPA: response regulator transcription factor [Roseiflexaceae bacterium]